MKNKREIDEFLRKELGLISDKIKTSITKDIQDASELHYLIGLNMGLVYLINRNGYAKEKKN